MNLVILKVTKPIDKEYNNYFNNKPGGTIHVLSGLLFC